MEQHSTAIQTDGQQCFQVKHGFQACSFPSEIWGQRSMHCTYSKTWLTLAPKMAGKQYQLSMGVWIQTLLHSRVRRYTFVNHSRVVAMMKEPMTTHFTHVLRREMLIVLRQIVSYAQIMYTLLHTHLSPKSPETPWSEILLIQDLISDLCRVYL